MPTPEEQRLIDAYQQMAEQRLADEKAAAEKEAARIEAARIVAYQEHAESRLPTIEEERVYARPKVAMLGEAWPAPQRKRVSKSEGGFVSDLLDLGIPTTDEATRSLQQSSEVVQSLIKPSDVLSPLVALGKVGYKAIETTEGGFQAVETGLQTIVEKQQARAKEKGKAGVAERVTSLAATAAKEIFTDVTFLARPALVGATAVGVAELATDKTLRKKLVEEQVAMAQADPVRTAVAVAANLLGAGLIAKGAAKLAGRAKVTHLLGLEVDTIPTGRLVDVVDPITGSVAKAFISPETVLKGVTESTTIPKKMTDLLEDIIPQKGTVDLLTTRTGGDIGDIGRIGLQADEVLDLVKGKDVTLSSGLDVDTILVGGKTGFEILDDTAPLLGGDPFPTAVDIFAMEAKELGPSLSVEEIAFGGKFFDEGVTGQLGEGKFKFEVKGAVIEDVPDIAKDFIGKIEPGVGEGTPFAVDFQQPGYTDSLRNIGKGLKSDIDIVKKLTGGEFVGPSGGFEDLIGLQQRAGKVVGTPFLVSDVGVSASSIAGLMGVGIAADLGIRILGYGGETLKIGELPDIMPKLGRTQFPEITDILDVTQKTDPVVTPIIVTDIVQDIKPIIIPDIIPDVTPIEFTDIIPIIKHTPITDLVPKIAQVTEQTPKAPSAPSFWLPSLVPGTGKTSPVLDYVFGPAKRKGQKQLYTGEQRRFLEADVKKILKRMGF